MKFFKDKLIDIRKSKYLSQTALSLLSGYSRKTISRWENGETEPKEGDIRKLANALDVSVETFSNLQPTYSKSGINISPLASSDFLFSGSKEKYSSRINSILEETFKLKKELEVSSILINTLLSAVPFAFYIKDNSMKYLTANLKFIKDLGLLPDFKVQGKTDEDLFTLKEARENNLEDRHVFKSGDAILNFEKFIPGSRKSKWGLTSKIPILDSNKNIAGIIGIFIDISERKKTEEKLKILYNALYNLGNGAGIVFGRYLDKNHEKFRVDFCSENLMEIGNLTTENFLNFTRVWEKLIHPDSQAYFISENKKQWGNPIQNYELKLVNQKTKETKWYNYTYYEESEYGLCIFLPNNKTVTEDKFNSLLYNILNNSGDSIRIFQLNPFRYVFISKSIEKIFGYPSENFLHNQEFRRKVCVHPEDRQKENELAEKTDLPRFRTYRIIKPDQSIVQLQETTLHIKNDGDDYIIAISNEIKN